MNVLISSAGKRVSLVKFFKAELNQSFKNSKVIATDANPALSAACQVADEFVKVPRINHPEYITIMLKICQEHDIKLIIPTIDTELAILAEHRQSFLNIGCHPVISDVEFIAKCRNKRLIHEFFESKGVDVAREFDKKNYKLPLFIKPSDGSRSEDTFLITQEKQLKDRFFTEERFMFLEYISPELFDEFTCDLYYDRKGKLKCAVPRKRIEVRDGEVNKGVTQNNFLVPYIRERLSSIEGARGCLTVQFFLEKDGERVVGIEINPRFGGGYPLSYLANAHFPKWLIDEYLRSEEIDDQFDTWEDNLLMLRYDNEILVHDYNS